MVVEWWPVGPLALYVVPLPLPPLVAPPAPLLALHNGHHDREFESVVVSVPNNDEEFEGSWLFLRSTKRVGIRGSWDVSNKTLVCGRR